MSTHSDNSLAQQRRLLGSTGVRLNSFGLPFVGNKIQGVQRKTYMGSGLDEHYANQVRDGTARTALGANGLSRRPAQATGTKAVEQEINRRVQDDLTRAAERGVERAKAEVAPRPEPSKVAPHSVPLHSKQIPAAKAANPKEKQEATHEAAMKRVQDMINKSLPKGMAPMKTPTGKIDGKSSSEALRDYRRKQGGMVMRSPKARLFAA